MFLRTHYMTPSMTNIDTPSSHLAPTTTKSGKYCCTLQFIDKAKLPQRIYKYCPSFCSVRSNRSHDSLTPKLSLLTVTKTANCKGSNEGKSYFIVQAVIVYCSFQYHVIHQVHLKHGEENISVILSTGDVNGCLHVFERGRAFILVTCDWNFKV